LLDASRGTLRSLTIAPELPGADDVIAAAVQAKVIVAIGHTDATYSQTRTAIANGASVMTHLFNGMPPIHHREPGPVLAALDAGLPCEIILDGHHVHPAAVRLVTSRSTEQLVLVTDAIAAAGAQDGTYELGGLRVTVTRGQARLTDGDSLAGSTLTMDEALRQGVRSVGLTVAQASAAASTTPARLLGIDGTRGSIVVGSRADLVHLDDDLVLQRVMVAGRWLDG
jgi:N-acetylglucosamine-6-phosphate deacetylase